MTKRGGGGRGPFSRDAELPPPIGIVPLQTADRGIITVLSGDASSDGGSAAAGEGATLRVGGVKKAAGGALSVHSAEVLSGELHVGSKVRGGDGGGGRLEGGKLRIGRCVWGCKGNDLQGVSRGELGTMLYICSDPPPLLPPLPPPPR